MPHEITVYSRTFAEWTFWSPAGTRHKSDPDRFTGRRQFLDGYCRTHACSCIQPGPPSEELAQSTAVFSGTVVSVREYERKGDILSSMDPTTVEFEVSRVWKGHDHQTMYLTTARDEGSCGFTFAEGEEYLVYSANGTQVFLCSRTRELSRAADDLAALGEGRSPTAGTVGPTPVVPELPELSVPVRPEEGTRNTPEASGSEGGTGGCSPGSSTADVSFLGLMAGVVWMGFRRRR